MSKLTVRYRGESNCKIKYIVHRRLTTYFVKMKVLWDSQQHWVTSNWMCCLL